MPDTVVSAGTLRSWLTEWAADYLELDAVEISADVSLVNYGLDSLSALSLCDDIEDTYELVVEPTLAMEHPTIDSLAEFLARAIAGNESPQDAETP